MDQFTSKVSSDKSLQVFKDVLSHTHFQVIGCKIGWKGNTHTQAHVWPALCNLTISHMMLGDSVCTSKGQTPTAACPGSLNAR